MRLIQLTYRSLWLSLDYLKHTQNTYINLQLHKNQLTQSLFYTALNISYKLVNTVLKNRMALSVSVVSPHDPVAQWQPWLTRQHHERVSVLHITSPGKRAEFQVHFLLNAYSFCTTVKSPNPKTNHLKPGTVCTCFP